MDNYYVKLNDNKLYVKDICKVVFVETGYHFMTKTISDKLNIKLHIPEYELEYFFECSEGKYQTLPIDLRRGCVHI